MNKDKIIVIIILTICISVMAFGFFKEHELAENKAYTNGKIIRHIKTGQKNYIKYGFYVNNIKYYSEKRVYSFECDNGVKWCIGQEFKVTYSTVDPNNNEIDLGKYNKFRPNRVRMFNLE